MDRKLRCIEPKYLVLLITSALFLPVRDSFQVAVVGRPRLSTTLPRCSSSISIVRQPQQRQLPIRSTGFFTPLPTRWLPRLVRPLKGSESDQDVSGKDEKVAAEDDMKVVDEPFAITAAAAATGGPSGSTAQEDEGGDATEGTMRDFQHLGMPRLVLAASQYHRERRK